MVLSTDLVPLKRVFNLIQTSPMIQYFYCRRLLTNSRLVHSQVHKPQSPLKPRHASLHPHPHPSSYQTARQKPAAASTQFLPPSFPRKKNERKNGETGLTGSAPRGLTDAYWTRRQTIAHKYRGTRQPNIRLSLIHCSEVHWKLFRNDGRWLNFVSFTIRPPGGIASEIALYRWWLRWQTECVCVCMCASSLRVTALQNTTHGCRAATPFWGSAVSCRAS